MKHLNKNLLILGGVVIVLLAWAKFGATCTVGAPMATLASVAHSVDSDVKEPCDCIGKKIRLREGWSHDGENVYLCLGIPK